MSSVITITNVRKSFKSLGKNKTILHDLTLEINQGEVFGFLGPNGAGKSTTIKLLLNFLRPDHGSLRIMGREVGKEEFRFYLGYLSEVPSLYKNLTARETLSLAGQLSGINKALLRERIPPLLEEFKLSHAADQATGTFSKGMKQRLGFAAALVHDPDLYILDEPMSGLDPVGRHLIRAVIAKLHAKGKTIFFSSHILSDIEDLCDRIGILHRGHLLYLGDLSRKGGTGNLESFFINTIENWDRENAE